MDGWLEFLVFVAFVAGGMLLDRLQKKGTVTSDESVSDDEVGDVPSIDEVPMPQNWPPEQSPVQATAVKPKVSQSKKKKKHTMADTTARVTRQQPDMQPTAETESEFALTDLEDVRKAVVWSEILNRKY